MALSKKKKILLIVAGSLLISVVLFLYFARTFLMITVFEKLVAKESENRVRLEIKGLQFDIFHNDLDIDSLTLHFDPSRADSGASMILEKMSFSEIELNHLNIKSLLLDGIFDARSFVVKYPSLRFITQEGNEKKITNIQEVFKILEKSSNKNYGILAKLDTLEVKYGRLKIKRPDSENLDFSLNNLTMILKDFNTLVNDSVYVYGRMFFSKSLFISALDVYKYVKPGYDVVVDSVAWRSDDYRFALKGLYILPDEKLPDSVSKVKVKVQSLLLHDFHLLSADSLSRIKVARIFMDGGSVDIYNVQSKRKSSAATKKKPEQLFKMIEVDTLAFDNIQMYLHDNNDTTLYFKRLSAYVEDLKFDSAFMVHPEKHFDYSRFKLYAHSFVARSLIKGYEIHNSIIEYNNKYKKIVFDGFSIRSLDGGFSANIDRLRLKMSLKKLFRKQFQEVDISLMMPEIDWDQRIHDFKEGKQQAGQKSDIAFLRPGNIDIVDSRIKLITRQSDSITVDQLRFLTKHLKYKKDTLFSFDTLFINTGKITFHKKGKFSFTASKLKMLDDDIALRSVKYQSDTGVLQYLKSDFLVLKQFDIKELVLRQKLLADSLLIEKPEEKLVIKSNNGMELAQVDTVKVKNIISGFVRELESRKYFMSLDVQHFHVADNRLEVFESVEDTLRQKFSVKLNLIWDHLKFGAYGDTPLSDFHGFNLKVTNAVYYGQGINLHLKSLGLNADEKRIDIKGLRLKHDKTWPKHKKWKIKDVSVKEVAFSDFDFAAFLTEDNVYFDKLLVDSLIFDVQQLQKDDKPTNLKEPIRMDWDKSLPFNVLFDTILVNNLFLNYAFKDTTVDLSYKLHNFSLVYNPGIMVNKGKLTVGSLFNQMNFGFDSLGINDYNKGFVLSVEKGRFNKSDHNLNLKNVVLNTGKADSTKAQIIAHTGDVSLQNIVSSDSLPVLVNVHQLKFSDIDLKVITKAKKVVQEQDSLKKMAGLYRFSPLLKKLSIDTIAFDNLDVKVFAPGAVKKRFTVDDLKLALIGLDVIPEKALDTIPVTLKNINALLYDRKFVSGDSLYRFKAERLNYNSYNNTLVVDSFYVTPRYDTLEFFKRHVWQTDRVNLFVKQFSLSGFDLSRWNREGFLYLDRIDVDGLIANIYRDKNFPRDTSAVKPLLQDMLRKVAKPFRIDSVTVHNAFLRYSELGEKSFKPGYVYFSDAQFKAYNITNAPKPNIGETLKITTRMKLMGEGNIYGNFFFPLENQGSQFYFNAKTDKLDLTLLNPMTQNLLGLTIESGKGKLEIPIITANDDLATGYLLFKYRMKIQLYNRKKAEKNKNKGVTSPLLNFVINSFVLKNRNPNWFNRPRLGVVYFERDKYKALPNYIWKSTLSGILSTMGFNNKQQRKRKKVYKKKEFAAMREAVKNEEKMRRKAEKAEKHENNKK